MLIDFRTLFPKYGIKPKGVLHIGANVGEEAPVYDELGIKNVIWVEANPYICEKLKQNIAPYGHKYYNFAATDEDGQVTLHESNNGSQSSSLLELGTHKFAHPEVHYIQDIPVLGCRMEHAFTGNEIEGIDFLNADIQGNELKALKGMGNLIDQFKWIYLEVNKEELYIGCALVQDLDKFLAEKGFKRVETRWCGNTGWGDALYIRK